MVRHVGNKKKKERKMSDVTDRHHSLGIIALLIAILPIVQVLSLLLGVMLGALAIDKVETLRLGDSVDLGGGQGGEGFLGEAVLDFLAFLALLLFPDVHGLEGGCSA